MSQKKQTINSKHFQQQISTFVILAAWMLLRVETFGEEKLAAPHFSFEIQESKRSSDGGEEGDIW